MEPDVLINSHSDTGSVCMYFKIEDKFHDTQWLTEISVQHKRPRFVQKTWGQTKEKEQRQICIKISEVKPRLANASLASRMKLQTETKVQQSRKTESPWAVEEKLTEEGVLSLHLTGHFTAQTGKKSVSNMLSFTDRWCRLVWEHTLMMNQSGHISLISAWLACHIKSHHSCRHAVNHTWWLSCDADCYMTHVTNVT